MKARVFIVLILSAVLTPSMLPQQVADTAFSPVIPNPEYPGGQGPVIAVDEGHYNFHTSAGRYLPFAELLRKDGYNVEGYAGKFTRRGLRDTRILVISNALNRINTENWYLPTPSAFSSKEIETLRRWVEAGGSLFLIADHMPMGGAASDLASAFGFGFTNGFAADTSAPGPAYFYRSDRSLVPSAVTNGRNSNETVSKVVTFTGQAFTIPQGATPVLQFSDSFLLMETDTAWVFGPGTRYTKIGGWSQGAFMRYGKGRLAMFGEAAMFTAQLGGPSLARVGMNSDYAEENYKLLLNIIHWLDGKIRE